MQTTKRNSWEGARNNIVTMYVMHAWMDRIWRGKKCCIILIAQLPWPRRQENPSRIPDRLEAEHVHLSICNKLIHALLQLDEDESTISAAGGWTWNEECLSFLKSTDNTLYIWTGCLALLGALLFLACFFLFFLRASFCFSCALLHASSINRFFVGRW
jgi:hypothetical protein